MSESYIAYMERSSTHDPDTEITIPLSLAVQIVRALTRANNMSKNEWNGKFRPATRARQRLIDCVKKQGHYPALRAARVEAE